MDTKTINLALQLWDQAGEMPYEVLQERGLLDGFVQFLKKSKLKVGTIFRRTSCHRELEVGQQLEYLYPTSWTSSLENASYFVEHSDDPNVVILCLIANKELQAIYNRRKNIFPIHMYEKNMYGKKEVIIHPIVLTVTEKQYKGNVCMLWVEELRLRNPLPLTELCAKICPKDDKLLYLPTELIEKVERYMTKEEQISILSRYK